MSTILVTVEVEGTKSSARARLAQAGFTVARVSEKRVDGTITPRDPTMRADARTDRPAGLDKYERAAYVRGYSAGCAFYIKKHGYPCLGPDRDKVALHQRVLDHEWDRHPLAHRYAMKELRRVRSLAADYRPLRMAS